MQPWRDLFQSQNIELALTILRNGSTLSKGLLLRANFPHFLNLQLELKKENLFLAWSPLNSVTCIHLTVWVQPGELDAGWASGRLNRPPLASALLLFIRAAAILPTVLDDVQELAAELLGYMPVLQFKGIKSQTVFSKPQPSCPLINWDFQCRGWRTQCYTEGQFVKVSVNMMDMLLHFNSQVWVETFSVTFSVFQLPLAAWNNNTRRTFNSSPCQHRTPPYALFLISVHQTPGSNQPAVSPARVTTQNMQ